MSDVRTSLGLPPVSAAIEKRFGPPTYTEQQVLANATSQAFYGLLRKMFDGLHGSQEGDADPLLQGAICGVVNFMVRGSQMTDAEIKAHLAEVVDRMLPQIRFAVANPQNEGRA